MARKNGKDDSGLYPVKHRWYLRISVYGEMQRFGKPRGFPTKEAARIFRDRLRASLRDRQYFPGQEQTTETIDELRLTYLESMQGKVASYRDKARHLIYWAERFPNRPILSIQPSDISKGISALHESCSQATANRYAETLRAMMRQMVKPFHWVVEFWREVVLYKPDERVMPIYTAADITEVFDHARERDTLVIYLNLLLGLRQSHYFAIRWEWINWEIETIRLPSFKRQKAFQLPLSTDALAILTRFHGEQGQPSTGWIFPARIQNSAKVNRAIHIDPHNWYTRTFKPLLRDLGLDHLTFHALRRTWATALGEKAPQRIIQMLGNWSDSKVVERYSRPQDASLRAAMEGVAKSLGTATLLPEARQEISPKLAKLLKIKDSPRSSVG